MTPTISNKSTDSELFDALRLELRRGCLVVAVLAQLKSEQYGYTLRKSLSDDGLVIDESTLYPLLRRLESQGLLLSEWREENKRNKRFYRLSPAGAQVLEQLLEEWRAMNASLDRILSGPLPSGGALSRERYSGKSAADEGAADDVPVGNTRDGERVTVRQHTDRLQNQRSSQGTETVQDNETTKEPASVTR